MVKALLQSCWLTSHIITSFISINELFIIFVCAFLFIFGSMMICWPCWLLQKFLFNFFSFFYFTLNSLLSNCFNLFFCKFIICWLSALVLDTTNCFGPKVFSCLASFRWTACGGGINLALFTHDKLLLHRPKYVLQYWLLLLVELI